VPTVPCAQPGLVGTARRHLCSFDVGERAFAHPTRPSPVEHPNSGGDNTSRSRGADCVRVLLKYSPSPTRGRRECRALASPMARLREKMQAAGTTGSAETSGIPCAMGLRIIRDLPGERPFLPPSSARSEASVRELGARVAAPGPHDFSVRHATSHLREKRLMVRRPPPPRLAFRDDCAYAPMLRRDGADNTTDLGAKSSQFLKNRMCAASRFAIRAELPSVAGDPKAVFAALAAVTAQCVAGPGAYRLK
jgi:hypothetical protein